eukprot:CAMPEP_0117683364 /NCGR_PEP_ID=MMETSP0804-20121206/20345_1 /TAXON_ID=1074897 /ORGANISM="Tetraselmis astigmatica, Strain CCMP880" /LENGTH=170 /DNA_ID=CAMNT_0005493921 /DNA_START=182 /DNA_END=694 /DNA_ORIENTATION=-
MAACCTAGAMIGIAAGTALMANALLVWINPSCTLLQDLTALLLPKSLQIEHSGSIEVPTCRSVEAIPTTPVPADMSTASGCPAPSPGEQLPTTHLAPATPSKGQSHRLQLVGSPKQAPQARPPAAGNTEARRSGRCWLQFNRKGAAQAMPQVEVGHSSVEDLMDSAWGSL